MKRIGYHHVACSMAVAIAIAAASVAGASPAVNGAHIKTRVFNDCPSSTVSFTNLYPASISFTDQNVQCTGGANLHNWSFSTDFGASQAVFNNNDAFRYCADLVLEGEINGEGGLRLSPWWSQDVDGRLNVRIPDGEIAAFGGRLPFYSFSNAPHNVRYVEGTSIHLEITYRPNGLSEASPGQIKYDIVYNGTPYSSGWLNFDSGFNPNDPPHGLWGIMDDARVGGYVQVQTTAPTPPAPPSGLTGTFSNICYEDMGTTPAQATTWGRLKAVYR